MRQRAKASTTRRFRSCAITSSAGRSSIEHALVEIKHVLERPGQFHVQAGRGDNRARFSHLQHQRLLRLVDGEQ